LYPDREESRVHPPALHKCLYGFLIESPTGSGIADEVQMYPIYVIFLGHLLAYLPEVLPDQGVGRVEIETFTGFCGALILIILGEVAPHLVYDQPLGMVVDHVLRG
jgi:hypothetical protein